VRYLIWKVKSTGDDASDFFRQADRRREERQMVETRGLFDLSYLLDSDSVAYRERAAGLYDEDPPIWYAYRHRVMNQRPCDHEERAIRAWKIAEKHFAVAAAFQVAFERQPDTECVASRALAGSTSPLRNHRVFPS
jgi:hypothetical protein